MAFPIANNKKLSDLAPTTGVATDAASSYSWAGRSIITSPADGSVTITNSAANGFTKLGLHDTDIVRGSGTPESNVTATVGSLYLRTNGGANTTLYVKESGSGNTGWSALGSFTGNLGTNYLTWNTGGSWSVSTPHIKSATDSGLYISAVGNAGFGYGVVISGAAGTTDAGGGVSLLSGGSADGNGGAIQLVAANGTGLNKTGGGVSLTLGNGTDGAGASGEGFSGTFTVYQAASSQADNPTLYVRNTPRNNAHVTIAKFNLDSALSGANSLYADFQDNGVTKLSLRKDGAILFPSSRIILAGSGTPEGAVTASIGSLWLRTNGGVGTSLYTKTSGTGNTGWTAIVGLNGFTNTTPGQISVNTGAGGISHFVGPTDQNYLVIAGPDASGATDGRGIQLKTGSNSDTGYGGSVSILLGDAGPNGTGQGGAIVYTGGRAYGTDTAGGNSNWHASRGTGSGEVGGFNYRIYGKKASGTAVHDSIDHQFWIARNLKTSGMALIQEEIAADPDIADLTADAAVAMYNKNDKLVFAYNNGGVMTYISIPLDGATTTWTHSTTAP